MMDPRKGDHFQKRIMFQLSFVKGLCKFSGESAYLP